MSGCAREDSKKSAEAGIPAQSYEADILPRYKEALSLGLRSYRSHIQKTNRKSSTGSGFNMGFAHGPLPHVIGSEEYIHDNSCGLTEDLILGRESLNPSQITETGGILFDTIKSGSDTMFSGDLFTEEQEPLEKEGNEPLLSAALDFKAMLEAALLSTYKFYDEEGPSVSDPVHGYSNTNEKIHAKLDHEDSTTLDSVDIANSRNATGIMSTIVPATAEKIISNQDLVTQSRDICSTLISRSLFDAEEESSTFLSSGPETLIGGNKAETIYNPTPEADDAISKGAVSQTAEFPNCSLSKPDAGDVDAIPLPSRSEGFISHVPEDGKSAGADSVILKNGEEHEGHSDSSNSVHFTSEDVTKSLERREFVSSSLNTSHNIIGDCKPHSSRLQQSDVLIDVKRGKSPLKG
ncbi:PREDICTED: uncharacterized protein LOC104605669 isoform X2 [Nelumbo nucifera]|nr:PREDICTED: uncharacterized protein LOC104605669 isoform X2 [Nelumbo nucifera]